jgi:hypothetical protein
MCCPEAHFRANTGDALLEEHMMLRSENETFPEPPPPPPTVVGFVCPQLKLSIEISPL